MDMDSFSRCTICVFLVCLLGNGLCSDGGKFHCPCPQPPPIDLAETPQTFNCCRIDSILRYKCQNGYVRKAGTSNLSRFQENERVPRWSIPTLNCIPDPRITTTPPPRTTGTNSNTVATAKSSDHWRTASPVISASPAAETSGTETSSPALRVLSDHTQDPVTNAGLANWTSASSLAATTPPRNASSAQRGSSSIGHSLSAIGILVIICAAIGIGVFYYKWRSKRNVPQPTEEELTPMNDRDDVPARSSC